MFGRILVGLAILGLVLGGIAYLIPPSVVVARSITIDATPEEVFEHLSSMQRTSEWSPWLDRDPDVVLTYTGPERGVGNRMEWVSDQRDVGTGTQEIVAVVPNERVETALDFGPMGTAQAAFLLEEAGDDTTVTWTFETDLGLNPISRYMGLFMDGWVGSDYERGLERLKAVVEG